MWRLALALAVLPSTAQADIDGSRFTSRRWKVQVTAPTNWQLSERAGYPNVILRMARRAPDGKILLSAEPVKPGETALGYATRTAKVLSDMGFVIKPPKRHVASSGYWVDAEKDGKLLRQAYVVAAGIGYSLTLSATGARSRAQLLRAFDSALRSLRPLSNAQLQRVEPRQPKPAPRAAEDPGEPSPEDGE